MKPSSNDIPFEESRWWFVKRTRTRAELPAEEHALWKLDQPDAPNDWTGELPDEPIEGFDEWLEQCPDGPYDDPHHAESGPPTEIDYDMVPDEVANRPVITNAAIDGRRVPHRMKAIEDWITQPSVPRPVLIEVPGFPEDPAEFRAYWAVWGPTNLANLEAEREYHREVRRRREETTPWGPREDFYGKEATTRRIRALVSERSAGCDDDERGRSSGNRL